MRTKTPKFIGRLRKLGACSESIEWASTYTNQQKAYKECPYGKYLLWLAARFSGKRGSQKHRNLILCIVDCAKLILPGPKNKDIGYLLECIRKEVLGEISAGTIRSHITQRLRVRGLGCAEMSVLNVLEIMEENSCRAKALNSFNIVSMIQMTKTLHLGITSYRNRRYPEIEKQCADIVRKHYPTLNKILE
jgi:hypothetical protein